jgi:hypothetical protein
MKTSRKLFVEIRYWKGVGRVRRVDDVANRKAISRNAFSRMVEYGVALAGPCSPCSPCSPFGPSKVCSPRKKKERSLWTAPLQELPKTSF